MPLVLDGNGDITGLTTGALEAAAIGTGAVRQVVYGTTTTQISISTTTFTSIGLSATITPTSSSSRILVMVSYPWNSDSSGTVRIIGGARILRDSTVIQTQTTGTLGTEFSNITTTSFRWRYNNHLIDTPSTTSAVTYSVQCSGEGTYSITYMNNGIPGVITLMEIA